MTEYRINRLEEDVGELREDNASLKSTVASLHQDIEALTEAVTSLTSALNKGKGAVYVVGAFAGAIGFVASWITTHIKG